jgi:hypothetical protein
MRTPVPKSKGKYHKSKNDQQPQDRARANIKPKHLKQKPGQSVPHYQPATIELLIVAPCLHPVPVDMASTDEDDFLNEDSEDIDPNEAGRDSKQGAGDSSEDVSSDDQDDVRNPDLDTRAVRARFNKEVHYTICPP